MAVQLVQFKIGLAVIAEVDSSCVTYSGNDDVVYLKNPAVFDIAEGKKIGFGVISPFIKRKQTLPIRREDILFIADVIPEIENGYNSVMGSGIVTAPAGALHGLQQEP